MPREIMTGEDCYSIEKADVKDSERASILLSEGYRFLDRVLEIEISPAENEDSEDLSSQGIEFVVEDTISDDIFELACEAYDSDRRFHLEPVFDREKASIVLKQYIEGYKRPGVKVFKAYHGSELLGFAVADETADPRGKYFENVLGATKPGIKGKLIAAPLYKRMLSHEAGRFKKYYGKVSSSNMASINLHFMLGGRIRSIYDEFIYKR